MLNELSTVLGNVQRTDALYVMTLQSPEIARTVLPGQFVHMEVPTLQAHILRRPFSVYDADPDSGTIDILYQVVGTGSADMTAWETGFKTTTLGPIGRRWFPPKGIERALLVGGGVGAAPLYMLCAELIGQGVDVEVVLGAATGEALVCRDRYESLRGAAPLCATDDGSFGAHGFATVHVEEILGRGESYDYAAVCGPEPMMRAVAAMTCDAGIRTQVSMERRMACGIGACLSCTCDTTEGRKRVCMDGPVFDVSELGWS